MSSEYLIIRRELAANAQTAITTLYSDSIGTIQAVLDGDGETLKTIHWGVMTPRFTPLTVGYLPQWFRQDIELELKASVDYADRTLDDRYTLLLQVLEDFCARPDLMDQLSSDSVIVNIPPTFDGGDETIENGRYITTYRLRVSARGRAEGE